MNDETDKTLLIPTLEELESAILESKDRAILLVKQCKMDLLSYDDSCLVEDTTQLITDVIRHGQENEEIDVRKGEEEETTDSIDVTNIAHIKEDIAVIKLKKISNSPFPTYIHSTEKGTVSSHSYLTVVNSRKSKKTPFVEYNRAYIRKTTALYLLQENIQISNDCLPRFWSDQPLHLFSGTDLGREKNSSLVQMGELCLFRQVDKEKALLGRVIQFSYLKGNKKQREFSGTFVDMSNNSYKNIGVYAN